MKRGKTTDRGWSHFAIPKGLEGETLPGLQAQAAQGVSASVSWPVLRKGSRGEAVRELQQKLMELGYDLGVYGADGIFGKKTVAAVKAFQRDCGIKVDGIAGPVTYGKLYGEEELT